MEYQTVNKTLDIKTESSLKLDKSRSNQKKLHLTTLSLAKLFICA